VKTKLFRWWCPAGHPNGPENRLCVQCNHDRIERHAQIHQSDRAVVYVNPITGERRTPARADLPLPAIYANQGFERHEILSMSQFERQTGLVHEATSFNKGNEPTPEAPNPTPPKIKDEVMRDLVQSIAPGAWTDPL
jgi:hypothetical protein